MRPYVCRRAAGIYRGRDLRREDSRCREERPGRGPAHRSRYEHNRASGIHGPPRPHARSRNDPEGGFSDRYVGGRVRGGHLRPRYAEHQASGHRRGYPAFQETHTFGQGLLRLRSVRRPDPGLSGRIAGTACCRIQDVHGFHHGKYPAERRRGDRPADGRAVPDGQGTERSCRG